MIHLAVAWKMMDVIKSLLYSWKQFEVKFIMNRAIFILTEKNLILTLFHLNFDFILT